MQPESTVSAQQATIASSKTDVNSFIAAEQTADANVVEAKADLVQKKADYDRALALYNEKLIARQDYDSKKSGLRRPPSLRSPSVKPQLHRRKLRRSPQRAKVNQAMASQRSNYDALDKNH